MRKPSPGGSESLPSRPDSGTGSGSGLEPQGPNGFPRSGSDGSAPQFTTWQDLNSFNRNVGTPEKSWSGHDERDQVASTARAALQEEVAPELVQFLRKLASSPSSPSHQRWPQSPQQRQQQPQLPTSSLTWRELTRRAELPAAQMLPALSVSTPLALPPANSGFSGEISGDGSGDGSDPSDPSDGDGGIGDGGGCDVGDSDRDCGGSPASGAPSGESTKGRPRVVPALNLGAAQKAEIFSTLFTSQRIVSALRTARLRTNWLVADTAPLENAFRVLLLGDLLKPPRTTSYFLIPNS